MLRRMSRIRVAAVDDYEIVVFGLTAMLSQFADRIEVADTIIIGQPVPNPVDVALCDTFGRRDHGFDAVRTLCSQTNVQRVAVYSAPITDALVEKARTAGATGVLSKSLPAAKLIDALERVAQGEVVITLDASPTTPSYGTQHRDWPGRAMGLTERESSVAVLLAEGLSNREIGEALFLSTNTIKTHVRRLLEKLKATNRTKAAWILLQDHSFRRS